MAKNQNRITVISRKTLPFTQHFAWAEPEVLARLKQGHRLDKGLGLVKLDTFFGANTIFSSRPKLYISISHKSV